MYVVDGYAVGPLVQNRSRIILLAAIGMFFSAVLILGLFPIHSHSHVYPHCPWHAITGTHCPGCGTLRGISLILQGDLLGLLKNNPMAMLLSPLLFYASMNLVTESTWGYRLPRLYISKWQFLLVGLIICYWIARNFWPVLAPNPI